jgi:hypothetical protein
MKLVKGGHRMNKTILIIGATEKRPYGRYQIGHIKGKGFKLRDLDKIKANGCEFTWDTLYFKTLKQAIKAIK